MQKGIGFVTRKKQKMVDVTLLHGLTGTLDPGRVTLLLGPPGGGKSLFLKTLAGLSSAPLRGSLTYNGHEQSEFNVRRTCRYVAQSNLLNPTLTVRETLTFSAMCQGPGYHRSARPARCARMPVACVYMWRALRGVRTYLRWKCKSMQVRLALHCQGSHLSLHNKSCDARSRLHTHEQVSNMCRHAAGAGGEGGQARHHAGRGGGGAHVRHAPRRRPE